MKLSLDPQLLWLFGGVLGLLVLASTIGAILRRSAKTDPARAVIDNLNARTRAWWGMSAMGAAGWLLNSAFRGCS